MLFVSDRREGGIRRHVRSFQVSRVIGVVVRHSEGNDLRVAWIDIAKGLGILLVVAGHSRLAELPVLGSWVNSFQMPLFFVLAGLCFDGMAALQVGGMLGTKTTAGNCCATSANARCKPVFSCIRGANVRQCRQLENMPCFTDETVCRGNWTDCPNAPWHDCK